MSSKSVSDIQLTGCVSYIPNRLLQVKVLLAVGVYAIFRQDKVTILLKTVKSTINLLIRH